MYLSGAGVGHDGSMLVSPYVPNVNIVITNLYHLNIASCVNCGTVNNHSTGQSLDNMLNWTNSVWDYTWIWKKHSVESRPDLRTNPKP